MFRPTFHGAANDLMAVTGTAIDRLARRLTAAASGIDLFAVFHAALPDGTTRSYSRTPETPFDLQPEGSNALRLRMSTETTAKIRAALADSEPARWIAVGDRNDTCNTVWLDDLIPLLSDADSSEVEKQTRAVGEATNGISRYLGDALFLDDDHPQPGDPRVTEAMAGTRAANGSIALVITAATGDIRFQLLPVDP